MLSGPRQLSAGAIGLTVLMVVSASACRNHVSGGPELAHHGPITSEELRRVGDRDTYSAIKFLRPQFLQSRGATSFSLDSPTEPEVFVDGMYYGPLGSLRTLPVREIAEIRLLTVGDAVLRYGTGHTAGVIDITSIH